MTTAPAKEHLSPSQSVNDQNTGKSGNDVDGIGHDRDDERIIDTGLLEECRIKVEDKS